MFFSGQIPACLDPPRKLKESDMNELAEFLTTEENTRKLIGFAAHKLYYHDSDDLRDAVQGFFAEAFPHFVHSFDPRRGMSFQSWFFRLFSQYLYRTGIKRTRGANVIPTAPDELPPSSDEDQSALDEELKQWQMQLIKHCWSKIPAGDRKLLQDYYFGDGATAKALASREHEKNWPAMSPAQKKTAEATVRRRLFRARERLRDCVSKVAETSPYGF